MTTRKEAEQARSVSAELVEEAARDFERTVKEAATRINTQYPNMIFQEKYATGWLWGKRTYYKYFRYSEGTMTQITVLPIETINSIERGK